MLNVILAFLITIIVTLTIAVYYYEHRITILRTAHAEEKIALRSEVIAARQEGTIAGIKLCKEAAAEGHPVQPD